MKLKAREVTEGERPDNKKRRTAIAILLNVDQTGLEPVTSRL